MLLDSPGRRVVGLPPRCASSVLSSSDVFIAAKRAFVSMCYAGPIALRRGDIQVPVFATKVRRFMFGSEDARGKGTGKNCAKEIPCMGRTAEKVPSFRPG